MFHTAEPPRGEFYQDLLRRHGTEKIELQQNWSPDNADERFSMNAYGACSPKSPLTNCWARFGYAASTGVTTPAASSTPNWRTARPSAAWSVASAWRYWKTHTSITATVAWSTRTCPITSCQSTQSPRPRRQLSARRGHNRRAPGRQGTRRTGHRRRAGRHRQRGVQRDGQTHHRPAHHVGKAAVTPDSADSTGGRNNLVVEFAAGRRRSRRFRYNSTHFGERSPRCRGTTTVCVTHDQVEAMTMGATGRRHRSPCQEKPRRPATTTSSSGPMSPTNLESHPGANDVVTNAGAMSHRTVRIRFGRVSSPIRRSGARLQAIAQPLRSLRQQCNVDVAPAQITRLVDAMAG